MKSSTLQLPTNPFDQSRNPKEVMRELLKKSKSLSHEEAMQRMKEAAEAQRKIK
jgi:hypothetical protein